MQLSSVSGYASTNAVGGARTSRTFSLNSSQGFDLSARKLPEATVAREGATTLVRTTLFSPIRLSLSLWKAQTRKSIYSSELRLHPRRYGTTGFADSRLWKPTSTYTAVQQLRGGSARQDPASRLRLPAEALAWQDEQACETIEVDKGSVAYSRFRIDW